jgi:hypothetical protein
MLTVGVRQHKLTGYGGVPVSSAGRVDQLLDCPCHIQVRRRQPNFHDDQDTSQWPCRKLPGNHAQRGMAMCLANVRYSAGPCVAGRHVIGRLLDLSHISWRACVADLMDGPAFAYETYFGYEQK